MSEQITNKNSYTGTVAVYDNLTVSATFVKKDATAPAFSFAGVEGAEYFRPSATGTAWGGANAGKIRLNLSDPQGDGEAVSGVKSLYIYKGALGSAGEVKTNGTETDVTGLTTYDVTIDSINDIYSFVLADGAGNLSEM
jgi:hypothetical protein